MLAGGRIKDLNTSLGVVIRFPDRESQSPNITIRGKAASIAAAEKALTQLAEEVQQRKEEQVAAREPSDRAPSESLKVDPSLVGRVIGRGGANIKKISQVSGARVDIRKDSGEIVVSGSKEAIDFAVKEFRDIIDEIQSRVTEVIRIRADFHSRLVGKGFAELHKIQDEFDVSIRLPKNKGEEEVQVIGRREDVAGAIEYLKEVVKEIEFDLKSESQDRQRRETEAKERQQEPHQGNGTHGGSGSHGGRQARQAIKADDPFFAPPPQATNIDKTSVWGARMS